jgi:hypothetical protein
MWCASPAALAWGYSDVNVTIVVDEERLRLLAITASTTRGHIGENPDIPRRSAPNVEFV